MSATKIGRNDPCPCGSGKKYKKCCLGLSPTVASTSNEELPDQLKQKLLHGQYYGEVRPIIHANFQGQKVVAVGNRLYYDKRWKTFPDFLTHYLFSVLGTEWSNAELKKPVEQRHQVLKWFSGLCKFQQAHKIGERLYGGKPNGDTAAFACLAYDLYVLSDNMAYQENVVKRLKNSDQFQGARYEIYVAASCIRAGYKIEYEDESDPSKSHPEFTATHKGTGQKIHVEAKSKHWTGILGFPGERKQDLKIEYRDLLRKALRKEHKYPFAIFIDLNLPPEKAAPIINKPPPNEFTDNFNGLDSILKNNKGEDRFNAILFTNIPHHYGREGEIDPQRCVLFVRALKPELIPEHPNALDEIFESAMKYGNIPNEFPEN